MKRYDQCDDTCTTDCGHCKGQGRRKEWPTPLLREQIERVVCRGLSRVEWSHSTDAEQGIVDDVIAVLAPHVAPGAVIAPSGYRVVQHPTCSLDVAARIHDGHVDEEGS